MKAMVFDTLGTPSVIHAVKLPLPHPGSGEVLVSVTAVSVNHVDTFVRSGAFETELATPHIIGRDAVGTVAALGDGVTTFQVGQRVWTNSLGYAGRSGATVESVVVAAKRLYPVPDGVDPTALIAAVHSAATASIVLESVTVAKPGQAILIEGAAGNVGRKFVQLAARRRLHVAATCNVADIELVTALGAETVVPYDTDFGAAWQVAGIAFDHIVDTSGRVPLQTNLDLLKPGGQVTLITAPETPLSFAGRPFYMAQKRLVGFVISHATRGQLALAAQELNAAFRHGALLEDTLDIRGFEDAAAAHADLEAGRARGRRIVLTPEPF